eukprot:15031976-Alexandrium_andersonii.AAC.1
MALRRSATWSLGQDQYFQSMYCETQAPQCPPLHLLRRVETLDGECRDVEVFLRGCDLSVAGALVEL